jgi:hypothetical protein
MTWINTHLRILHQRPAAAKAQARKLGGREGRGFAEVEAGIELAVEDGLRDARTG